MMTELFDNKKKIPYDEAYDISADDSSTFAKSEAETLHDIANIAHSYNLKINANKNKGLASNGALSVVYLNRVQIEKVNQFKYLGSLMEEQKPGSKAEVHNRTGQACHLWIIKLVPVEETKYLSENQSYYMDLKHKCCSKADLNNLEVFIICCLYYILESSPHNCLKN